MSERLNKYIASAGICSRRDADNLISNGKVIVNGEIAILGQHVSDDDIIMVNGKRIGSSEKEKIVLAFYKPIGVTCTEKDRFAKKKIKDVLHYPIRLTYAGRLDKDSEGLLLMTNDGELIDKMMRGDNAHEKEYLVKVDKEITDEFLSKMSKGIYLADLNLTTKPCQISKQGKFIFKIILTQGVNKQIRRMCENCGYRVKNLKRLRVINIELANLKPGEFRRLKSEELESLYHICKMNIIK